MLISELKKGEKGKLAMCDKNDLLSKRLAEMGCRNGMEVSVVLFCGDLAEVRIGETLFALKKSCCSKIFADK